jgi:ribosomal-protein-alanine N-acetyltransferase
MNALLQPRHELRAMRLADLDEVMTIEASAYSFPWTRGNFVDSLAAGYLTQVCADRNGVLAGYFVAMPGVEEWHLLNITVAPRHQHQGLALLMLDALEAHARATARRAIWLEVRTGNQRARDIYRRRGFVEAGVRKRYYPAAFGQREDAVVMRALLGAGPEHALV